MQIVRDLAGYSMADSDNIRRAMSKKKQYIIDEERKTFVNGDAERGIRGCVANGISEKVANSIYDDMVDFAKYAFNKSHAAAYATVAYQTAYLKLHYGPEYMCAAMSNVTFDKIGTLLKDCQKLRIVVNGPDVNKSDKEFSTVDGEIYFGLGSIKGIASGASLILKEREFPYASLMDFINRCTSNKKIVKALIDSGAFDEVIKSRAGAHSIYDAVVPIIKKLNERREKLVDPLSSERVKENSRRMIEECEEILKNAEEIYEQVSECSEDEKLAKEYEVLGFYVSGHPLNKYVIPEHVISLCDLEEQNEGFVDIAGVITDVKTQLDKNGNEMCFVVIADKTGEIRIPVFASQYAIFKNLLNVGEAVIFNAKLSIEGNEEEGKQVNLFFHKNSKVKRLKKDKKTAYLMVETLFDVYNEDGTLNTILENYLSDDEEALELVIKTELPGNEYKTNFKVLRSIEKSTKLHAFVA